jgi:hypothetical protein
MTFWTTSDNQEIKATTTFESGGGNSVIPDNTTCLAMIDEAQLTSYEENTYINIRWQVLEPAAYKNRKVFQKIKCFDADPKVADKAKKMLAAIDANAGGKLATSDKAPDDISMAKALLSKPMLIKVMTWELNDRKGNWVSMVSPRKGASIPEPIATKEPTVEDVDNIPW